MATKIKVSLQASSLGRQTDRQTAYLNTEFLQLHGIGFQESCANKNYYNYICIIYYNTE